MAGGHKNEEQFFVRIYNSKKVIFQKEKLQKQKNWENILEEKNTEQ